MRILRLFIIVLVLLFIFWIYKSDDYESIEVSDISDSSGCTFRYDSVKIPKEKVYREILFEEETPEEVYERGYVEGFNRAYDEKKNYDASSGYIVNKEEYEEGYDAGYKRGKDRMKNKY